MGLAGSLIDSIHDRKYSKGEELGLQVGDPLKDSLLEDASTKFHQHK